MKEICKRSVSFIVLLVLSCSFAACSSKKTATVPKTAVTSFRTTDLQTRPATTAKSTAQNSTDGSNQSMDIEEANNVNNEIPSENTEFSGLSDDLSTDTDISELPTYDFGGRTIKIWFSQGTKPGGTYDYDDRSFMADRYDSNGIYKKGFNAYLDKRYDKWRQIEEKMNCKIRVDFTGTGWTSEKTIIVPEILAGVCKYDLFWSHTTLPDLVNLNVLLAYSDYIDFSSVEKLNSPVVAGLSSFKNKSYLAFEINPYYPFTTRVGIQYECILYNFEKGEREGIPDLFSLYRSGQWDWGKLVEIAQMATRDVNGDGINDSWGICNVGTHAVMTFMHANGVAVTEKINGKYTSNMAMPAAYRACQFMSDLVNIYKVAIFDNKPADSFMVFGPNTTETTIGGNYRNFKIKSRFVPVPLGPDNTEGKYAGNMSLFGWVMPNSERDPIGITRLAVNMFFSKLEQSYGEEVDNTKAYFNTNFWPGASEDFSDLIDFWIDGYNGARLLSDKTFDYWPVFQGANAIIGNMLFNMLRSFTPVSEAINSIMPSVQASLDNYN